MTLALAHTRARVLFYARTRRVLRWWAAGGALAIRWRSAGDFSRMFGVGPFRRWRSAGGMLAVRWRSAGGVATAHHAGPEGLLRHLVLDRAFPPGVAQDAAAKVVRASPPRHQRRSTRTLRLASPLQICPPSQVLQTSLPRPREGKRGGDRRPPRHVARVPVDVSIFHVPLRAWLHRPPLRIITCGSGRSAEVRSP